jgi:hypothetical protein
MLTLRGATEADRAGNWQAELARNESHLFRYSVRGFSGAYFDAYQLALLVQRYKY